MITLSTYTQIENQIQKRINQTKYNPYYYPSIEEIQTYIEPNLSDTNYLNYAIFLTIKECDVDEEEQKEYLKNVLENWKKENILQREED